MPLETESLTTARRLGQNAAERLTAIASTGYLRVGVPIDLGGHGGTLQDLFQDPAARQWLRDLPYPDQWLFRSQRLVVEALLRSDNVGLRELVLPELLDGAMGGASAMECPCLTAMPADLGWRLNGRLVGVPNLQWAGFYLLLPVQVNDRVDDLLLVRSEENDVTVQAGDPHELWQQAACGTVSFRQVFLRADEWLGDRSLWQTLADANRALQQGLGAALSRSTN